MSQMMHEGIPRSYWRFRVTFLIIQAVFVAGVLTTAIVWGFHDGKVVDFSVEFLKFSKFLVDEWFK